MLCCMSGTCDLYGRRNHCNTVVSPVKRIENGVTKYYCMSHWKTKLSKCRYCSNKTTIIDKDGWGYCSKHKINHVEFKNSICKILENYLPSEISEEIYVKT